MWEVSGYWDTRVGGLFKGKDASLRPSLFPLKNLAMFNLIRRKDNINFICVQVWLFDVSR